MPKYLEKQVEIGKNTVLVGLELTFGAMMLLEKFGASLQDIEGLAQIAARVSTSGIQ